MTKLSLTHNEGIPLIAFPTTWWNESHGIKSNYQYNIHHHDNGQDNDHGKHDHLDLTMVMKPTTRRPLSTIPGTTLLILSISINSDYFFSSLMHFHPPPLWVFVCLFVHFQPDAHFTKFLQKAHSTGTLKTIWKSVRNVKIAPFARQTGSLTGFWNFILSGWLSSGLKD